MQQIRPACRLHTDALAVSIRLWRALAEHALKARNYDTAEKSFVRCADYQVLPPTSPAA